MCINKTHLCNPTSNHVVVFIISPVTSLSLFLICCFHFYILTIFLTVSCFFCFSPIRFRINFGPSRFDKAKNYNSITSCIYFFTDIIRSCKFQIEIDVKRYIKQLVVQRKFILLCIFCLLPTFSIN